MSEEFPRTNLVALGIGCERKHSREIATVWAGNGCVWNGATLRSAYDLVVKSWCDAGLEPHRLAALAPGVGKRYGAFKQKRRFVERADVEQVKHFEIVRLQPGGRSELSEWELDAALSTSQDMFMVGCVPSLVPAGVAVTADIARQLLVLTRCSYGWMMRQPLLFTPGGYAYGLTVEMAADQRPRDHRMNIQEWGWRRKWIERDKTNRLLDAGILRDIFPENYLGRTHLAAKLGHTRTTLREWIEAEPGGRGALEPFSDILTKWIPPIEKIPQIREELYRAGRVYYWRWENVYGLPDGSYASTDLHYRPDLSAPWEAPEPIPEIYRADYWKDKDPGLTY